MRFGMLYELQLPKPWDEGSEQRLVDDAIEQCVLGDKLGIDYAWSVEHHFLEEYSHCSASEVFLSAIAARTEKIKIGFGIRQVISNYNRQNGPGQRIFNFVTEQLCIVHLDSLVPPCGGTPPGLGCRDQLRDHLLTSSANQPGSAPFGVHWAADGLCCLRGVCGLAAVFLRAGRGRADRDFLSVGVHFRF